MTDERLTSQQVVHIGKTIYGEVFIAELAKAIEYDQSSIFRAVSGGGIVSKRLDKLVKKLAHRKKIALPIK